MTSGKESFVLYHDIRGPLELLTDEERGRLFLAILDYSEKGILPGEYNGALKMAFAFIRCSLDRDAKKWEDTRQKRIEAGRAGGKQTQANRANATFAKQIEQTQANQAVPVPVPAPVPVPVPAPVIENKVDKPPRAPRYTPPTVEEVRAYCEERKNSVDPQRWYDYYSANGWRVGKNPMKDWKAAVRTWENSGYDYPRGKETRPHGANNEPRDESKTMEQVRRLREKIRNQ